MALPPEPETGSASGAASPPPGPAGLMQSLQGLWGELPGLLTDRVEILSLELQRAGLALVKIIVLVVAAAILGVTAWLVLWAGLVAGAVALGLHIALALLLALVLNVGAAAIALWRIPALLALLKLPATKRHLSMSAGADGPRPRQAAPADTAAPDAHLSTARPTPA